MVIYIDTEIYKEKKTQGDSQIEAYIPSWAKQKTRVWASGWRRWVKERGGRNHR